ncbi:MAG: NfeD family protein [Eubacteriales bacterium]
MSAVGYWLIVFVVLLLFEIVTMGLTTVWFAGGALIAALASNFITSEPIQIIIFLVSSIILLVLTRPFALKYVNRKVEKTNAESIIGTDTIVIEDIDELHGTGKVRVNGIEWSAKNAVTGEVIKSSEVVTIMGIQGVKAIVTKKQGE